MARIRKAEQSVHAFNRTGERTDEERTGEERTGEERTGEERTGEENVRNRAYAIWEQEGRPDGRHEEHWQQAERELQSAHPEYPKEAPEISHSLEEETPLSLRRLRNKRA